MGVSVLLGLFLLTSLSFGAEVIGKVAGVFDGDTLEVLHHQHPERIRFSGIDCPEKGQAWSSYVVENLFLVSRLYRFFPLSMGFNTAWSLRQIVPTQNSRTCEC